MSTKTLSLHPLDQIAPRCYIRGLLCFPLLDEAHDRCIDALQASLDATVAQSPFLSGRLQLESTSTGRLQLTFPTSDVKKTLQVKRFPHFSHSYSQLRDLGMPNQHLPLEFGPIEVMRPDLSSPVEAFGVQANLIPGGLILAIYAHHALVDGIGYGIIATQMAGNCALALEASSEKEVVTIESPREVVSFDRINWQDSLTNKRAISIDIPGYPVYNLLSTSLKKGIPVPIVPKQVRTFIFSRSSISKLKSLLVAHLPDKSRLPNRWVSTYHRILARMCSPFTSQGDEASNTWISTYDSILALLWTAITLARLKSGVFDQAPPESLSSTTTQLMYPTDSRKILRLPKLYCHNAGISTQTPPIPVQDFTLTDAEFLSKVALHVRKTTNSITETRARQAISFSNSLPDVRARQRPAGLDIGLSGQYDLMFTSWAQLPFYDLEWGVGLGKAEWVRVCPHEPAGWDGLGYIMPEREILGASDSGKAEVEIVLGLRTEVMEALCEEKSFLKWVDRII